MIQIGENVPWKSGPVPVGYWNDVKHHRLYFDWLGQQLQYKKPQDWYRIHLDDMIKHRGGGLLTHYYGNSPSLAISTVYPNYDWKLWKFPSVPHDYWSDINRQREFFDWLFKELEMDDMEDWYSVESKDINERGGTGFLSTYYSDSPSSALMTVYPEYDWQPWRFRTVPNNYWNCMEHQRNYLDWIAEIKRMDSVEDWYSITHDDLVINNGIGLMLMYGRSTSKLLESVYCDTNWQEWKFEFIPNECWNNEETVKQYMEWLEDRFNIEHHSRWNCITKDIIEQNYGGGLISKHEGNVNEWMRYHYSNEWMDVKKWNIQDGERGRTEQFLFHLIRSLVDHRIELQRNYYSPWIRSLPLFRGKYTAFLYLIGHIATITYML
jgi:hypothetical protein